MPQGDRTGPQGQGPKTGQGGDQDRAPAGARAKAEAAGRVAAGSLNILTNQFAPLNSCPMKCEA